MYKMGTPFAYWSTEEGEGEIFYSVVGNVWTTRSNTLDWCHHMGWNFHKFLRHALKTGKHSVDWWSWRQTSCPEWDQDFHTKRDFLPYFSTTLGRWLLKFCQRRQRWLVVITQKQCCLKLLLLSRISDQMWAELQGQCWCTTMLLPIKQGPRLSIGSSSTSSVAPSSLQSRPGTVWLLVISNFEGCSC